jgi:hypothetical protein
MRHAAPHTHWKAETATDPPAAYTPCVYQEARRTQGGGRRERIEDRARVRRPALFCNWQLAKGLFRKNFKNQLLSVVAEIGFGVEPNEEAV